MPNSPIRRFESCCMPPKKFWRFDNVNSVETSTSPVREIKNSSPVKEQNHKMGLMIDEDVQPKPSIQESPFVHRPSTPATQIPLEDAPLDFSVRNHVRGQNSELHNSTNNATKDGEFKHPMQTGGYSDYTKRDHMQLMAFPGLSRERNSPPSETTDNPAGWCFRDKSWNNNHNSQSHNRNQTSSNMDTSENSTECHVSVNGLNGGTMLCRKSPERNPSRENSPSTGISILQGMLKSQEQANVNKISSKIHNIHISPSSEQVQSGNNSEHVNTMSPAMAAAASQHILPHLLPPVNNLVPLPMATLPFLGGMGYARPPVYTGSLLSPGAETSVLQALTQRRARRKKPDERPFKSYPIDVLEEKLQSVSANVYAYGLEYTKHVMANGMTSSDIGANASISESPEYANNSAISSNSPHVVNGIENPSNNAEASSDSNDSLPPAGRTETAEATSCTSNRKRKSTADVEKDEAYWDRRRKNNLAAKRSREARRRKEDAIANMAIIYESQNIELQQNVATLTYKLNEITGQFGKVIREKEGLIIQNKILQDRLSQKRCGHCGTQLPNIN